MNFEAKFFYSTIVITHMSSGSNCLKGLSCKVIVDEKQTKDLWKKYMEKLINEANEWDHGLSAGIKEVPANCIRIAAALKKMKRHKNPGLSEG